MEGPIEPIAVIGMGCRLPGGANDPEKLWSMVAEGRSGWGEVPADRWNWKSFYHPNPEAREAINSKSGYFLEGDVAAFDASFFKIPVWEAHGMVCIISTLANYLYCTSIPELQSRAPKSCWQGSYALKTIFETLELSPNFEDEHLLTNI